jgi:predicted acetyltransferase
MSTRPVEIRPVTAEERVALARTFSRAMSFPLPTDERLIEHDAATFEYPRSLGAFEGDQVVASAHSHLFDLSLPGGGSIAAAGVTMVGVAATHRRRGLLTSLMRKQLSEARERGEPIAILLASESVIYGRFGYGLASTSADLEIDARRSAFARHLRSAGSLSFIDEEAADKILPGLHERARRLHPGDVERQQAWWDGWRIRRKPGETSIVIHESGGQVDGYVQYAIQSEWDRGLPNYRLDIRDLHATSEEAAEALWRFCFDVDLVTRVRAWSRPLDDPLRFLLADPRQFRVSRVGDQLWARPLSVPPILSARCYSVAGDLVIRVTDDFMPEVAGVFSVSGDETGGQCSPSTAPPHIQLSASDLGHVCLGSGSLRTLERAGRVKELRSGAIRRADAMFAWHPGTWLSTGF